MPACQGKAVGSPPLPEAGEGPAQRSSSPSKPLGQRLGSCSQQSDPTKNPKEGFRGGSAQTSLLPENAGSPSYG